MNDQAIRNRIVRKMLRKRIVGSHKRQIDSVVNISLPIHERGRGRTVVEEMLADPDAPLEGYGGGGRENVRLVSVEAAVAYLKAHDGDVPFGFD